MSVNLNLNSHLVVNGYTINPIMDARQGLTLLSGLGEYPPEHKCDADHNVVHKNYLGQIYENSIMSKYINIEGERGLFCTAILTNGHYTLRIWDETKPARVRFDAYVKGAMYDADLILDHLKAPAIPWDGVGLFDYTYSINQSPIIFSPMMKQDISKDPYTMGTGWKIDYETLTYEGTPNQLNTIKCYFCPNDGKYWGITPTPIPKDFYDDCKDWYDPTQEGWFDGTKDTNNFKSVPACEMHIKQLNLE